MILIKKIKDHGVWLKENKDMSNNHNIFGLLMLVSAMSGPYVYCLDNPMNAVDPDGKDIHPVTFRKKDNRGI